MKPTKFLSLIAALAVAVFGLTSCNDDNDNPSRTAYLDFLTYEGSSANLINFSYQSGPNTPVLELTAEGSINENAGIKIGERVVAYFYTPGDTVPTRNTTIQLLTLMQAFNGVPEVAVNMADSTSWDRNSIYVTAFYRTGNYLNLGSNVQQTKFDAQKYALYIDQPSLNHETVELYLVNLSEPALAVNSSQFFSSFNISSLVSNPNVKNLRVHVNNSNNSLTKNVFEFPLR